MGVKIISKRKVTKENEEAIMPLIIQLRKLAKVQPGFEYEETWRHLDHPDEYLVVREWESEDDWQKWHSSEQRNEVQERIEALLPESRYSMRVCSSVVRFFIFSMKPATPCGFTATVASRCACALSSLSSNRRTWSSLRPARI